jgi:hypothetical protein
MRPVEFEILLVLTGGESHGYGVIKEVEERSGGRNRVATGTLYRALRRLTSAGLTDPAGRRAVAHRPPTLDSSHRLRGLRCRESIQVWSL